MIVNFFCICNIIARQFRKLTMKKSKKNKKLKPKSAPFEFVAESELDFHKFGEMTLYDIEKYLNEFIEDSYVSKLTRLLVITGKGAVVKPLVLRLLKQNKYVESFKMAGYFNGQGGAIEVQLRGI